MSPLLALDSVLLQSAQHSTYMGRTDFGLNLLLSNSVVLRTVMPNIFSHYLMLYGYSPVLNDMLLLRSV